LSLGRAVQSDRVGATCYVTAFSQIFRSQLDSEALVAAVRAIEALAHERSIARLRAHSEDVPPLDEVSQLPYDPASVFLLEIMVSITSQAPQYIEELW
jgi:brefeldin A-resistance guanine nucleotide exchange factor 1